MTQITGTDGNTILRMRYLWEWAFKACLLTAPAVGWAAWVHLTSMNSLINKHDTALGILESRMNVNTSRNDEQDRDIRQLNAATANIEGRLHGIASQMEKLPGRVAEKLARDDQDN